MLKTVMDSRAGMGFAIMLVFFALFSINYVACVLLMWGGAMYEFIMGLHMGTKSAMSISYTIFLMIYVTFSSYILYRSIGMDFWGCYVIVQFVGTSDTAQYYVGKNFGSIRIFPASPKKSLEGYLGGLFFSFLALKVTCPEVDMLTCLILTFSGMFGDFLASVWKRLVGIKDASAVFGSHGGFLDRFDSHACVFCLIGILFRLERVIKWKEETMFYPLFCWIVFCTIYHTYTFLNKK